MLIKGFEWTTETRIIAVLANRLGGKIHISPEEMESPEGLLLDNAADGGVKIEATLPYENELMYVSTITDI